MREESAMIKEESAMIKEESAKIKEESVRMKQSNKVSQTRINFGYRHFQLKLHVHACAIIITV